MTRAELDEDTVCLPASMAQMDWRPKGDAR